jgi:stage V sporulation protein B
MGKSKNTGMRRQSFLHGALIMVVAITITKIIGALYKIPLADVLTPVGNGYFTNAYSIYNPLFSLATAGFPIAISRLVSENNARGRYRDIRQIHRASIRIFLFLGILSLSIMVIGAKPYMNFVLRGNASSALPAVYAIAPAVFFASMMSIYRGYYEGLRNMYPAAISEVIESLCRLIFGLTAACLIVNSGLKEYAQSGTVYGVKMASENYAKLATLPFAAAGAVFGVSLGGMFGFLFLFAYHKRNGDGITKEMLCRSPRPLTLRATASRLIRTAVPVAIGSLAVNLSSLVDGMLLQGRIGDVMVANPAPLLSMYTGQFSREAIATGKIPSFLYGCYGNALTLFMIVPAITQAFGVSALPSVTEAWTQGNPKRIRHSIQTVLRVVVLITVPCGLGLSVFAVPICQLIYPHSSPDIVGKILVTLGLASIFAATSTPIDSMLQAVGRVDLPVKVMFIGLAVKIILNYTLVGIPEINVMGAGTSTLVCYVIITVLALYFLCSVTKVHLNFLAIFLKPVLASVVSVGAAWGIYHEVSLVIPSRIAVLIAIPVSVFLYMACILWFRALNRHDILMLPNGQKIAKILEKHNWIR